MGDSSDVRDEAAAARRLDKASCLRCGSSALCPYRGYGRDELWYEINKRIDKLRPAALHDAAWCANEQRTILNLVWHYGQLVGHYGQAEGNWQQSYSEYTGEGWVCGKCQGGDFECHSPRCIKRQCPILYQPALSDAGLRPVTVYIAPRTIASMVPPYPEPPYPLSTAIKYRIQQARTQPEDFEQNADPAGSSSCSGCHMLAFVVYDSQLQWCKRCYPAAAPFSPDTQPKEWQARRDGQEVSYDWRPPPHHPQSSHKC